MLSFTNARMQAEFADWPSGAARVKCKFEVEFNAKKGYRTAKTTTDKFGNWCKPKKTTYSGPQAIVDGSDGKTYILAYSKEYGFITVFRSDFMHEESIYSKSLRDGMRYNERFDELLTLIKIGTGASST